MKDWSGEGNPWIVKASRRVLSNSWFDVEANDVVRPDGSEGAYDVVRIKKVGVGIVAIEANGFVHMIGQWRLPISRFSWELPMGGVEAGEATLAAARRELSEETGVTAANWMKLLELDLSTSLTDERCVAFLATGLTKGAAHPEGRESIHRKQAHFLEVIDCIESGFVREGASVAALLYVHRLARENKLPEHVAASILRRP